MSLKIPENQLPWKKHTVKNLQKFLKIEKQGKNYNYKVANWSYMSKEIINKIINFHKNTLFENLEKILTNLNWV